jgi:hypothetical protein
MTAASHASVCVLSPLSIGWRAVSLMSFSVGAMTNRLRNRARPTSTWFGGMPWRPRAFRVSDSTMMMRVKLVVMTISAGATESSVSRMMTRTPCEGFSLVPPRSMLIEA